MDHLTEIHKLYELNSRPTDIPELLARQIGRLLIAANYQKIGGFVTNPDSQMTVRQMLRHYDDFRRYVSQSVNQDHLTIGPNYTNDANTESYLPGIALWQLKK